MAEQTTESIVTDIRGRLEGLNERFSEEAIAEHVRNAILSLGGDDEFVRKMKFGGDARLAGTKFARYGYSVGDIEFLYMFLDTANRNGVTDPVTDRVVAPPSEELRNAFSALTDGEVMTSLAAKARDVRRLEEMFEAGALDGPGMERALAALDHQYRAMDTAESGFGNELIGAQYVGDLWAGARLQSRVFGLIPTFPMSAPTAYLPVEADIPELLFVSESTANNSSNYDTVKTGSNRVQVDAKKFVIHQMWSGEMEEDAIIPYIPFLRRQAQVALSYYSDSLVLNGDETNAATGNINLDDADPADTKHYLAFDGIRHAALVDNTGNGLDASGAITVADLFTVKGYGIDTTYLHDWGHPVDPNDWVYVADPETADKIAQLSDILTVDKFGPNAPILNGQVAKVLGNPLLSSIAVSKTEADGKVSNTGGNNTKGQVVAFNRRGYAVGIRRQLRVEVERIPATDQTRIVYSLRMGVGRFTPTGAASGIESAAVIYNITV